MSNRPSLEAELARCRDLARRIEILERKGYCSHDLQAEWRAAKAALTYKLRISQVPKGYAPGVERPVYEIGQW